jgi:hypothetical protein
MIARSRATQGFLEPTYSYSFSRGHEQAIGWCRMLACLIHPRDIWRAIP